MIFWIGLDLSHMPPPGVSQVKLCHLWRQSPELLSNISQPFWWLEGFCLLASLLSCWRCSCVFVREEAVISKVKAFSSSKLIASTSFYSLCQEKSQWLPFYWKIKPLSRIEWRPGPEYHEPDPRGLNYWEGGGDRLCGLRGLWILSLSIFLRKLSSHLSPCSVHPL